MITQVTCVDNIIELDFPNRIPSTAVDAFQGVDIIVNNTGYTRLVCGGGGM